MNYLALQDFIGYKFENQQLLHQAFVHSSAAHEVKIESNERLEFLGDAVLQLLVTNNLFHTNLEDEGALSKERVAWVNTNTLAKIAKYLDLGTYLVLGNGEEKSGGRNKENILANTFEALLGAVFTDGGYGPASRMIMRLRKQFEEAGATYGDHKTLLQEIAHSRGFGIPRYGIPSRNENSFVTYVYLDSIDKYAPGGGRSIKEAEKAAAQRMLKMLEKV